MLKFIGAVVVAFFVVIVLGAAFMSADLSKKSPSATSQHDDESSPAPVLSTSALETPAISVSPTVLRMAYDENEVRADGQYRGKILDMNGMVQEIRKDFTDRPVLEIFTGIGKYSPITAYMNRGQNDSLAELVIGSPVHLRCKGAGRSIGDPLLEDCVLMEITRKKPEPASATAPPEDTSTQSPSDDAATTTPVSSSQQ